MKSPVQRWLQFVLVLSVVSLVAEGALAETRRATRARAPETPSKMMCELFKVGCVKRTAHKKKKTTKPEAEASATKAKSEEPPRQAAAASPPKPETAATIAPPKSAAPPPAPKPRPPVIAATAPEEMDRTPVPKPKQKPTETAAPMPPPISRAPVDASEEEATRPPQSSEESRCRDELRSLGAVFTVPERVETSGQCHVDNPVQLSSLRTASGEVKLPGHPLFNCAFARRFVTWAIDVAAPIVANGTESTLAAMSTGPGYECRGRNGDASAKISEHAFGNAVDIDGIVLKGGPRIEIADVADPQHRFHRVLMALRESGCGYFSTVLGPGANAAHASHYHFDLGRHGKSENYRICE